MLQNVNVLHKEPWEILAIEKPENVLVEDFTLDIIAKPVSIFNQSQVSKVNAEILCFLGCSSCKDSNTRSCTASTSSSWKCNCHSGSHYQCRH